ncbi:MAG: hypothetical protein AB7G11_02385 [Phycisphaerales bacterium]
MTDSLKVSVPATLSKHVLLAALRDLTIGDERFDHRQWSLWEAKCLEDAARMIREGYARAEAAAKSKEVGER